MALLSSVFILVWTVVNKSEKSVLGLLGSILFDFMWTGRDSEQNCWARYRNHSETLSTSQVKREAIRSICRS